MTADGEYCSAHWLVNELLKNRRYGLIHYKPKEGTCQVRIFGEADETAFSIAGAHAGQLAVLAHHAEFVKPGPLD